MTTQPLAFPELLTIILIVGTFILIILSITNISIKKGGKGISFTRKRKGEDYVALEEGISPHSVCRHRFDIIDIYHKVAEYNTRCSSVLFQETKDKQFHYARTEMQEYVITTLNCYQDRLKELAPGEDNESIRMRNYQFFKLLFELARRHTFDMINGLIKNNGFIKFEGNKTELDAFKEKVFVRLKADWSGILDEYYHSSLIIPRSEIGSFNEPRNVMKEATDRIIDKMVEITIETRDKIENIHEEIKDYIINTFNIDIELDRNSNISRARDMKKKEN